RQLAILRRDRRVAALRIAAVAHAVAVDVDLIGVGRRRAVVGGVADAVVVGVGAARAAVAGVAQAVVVGVLLAGVGRRRTVVDGIRDAVAVEVGRLSQDLEDRAE